MRYMLDTNIVAYAINKRPESVLQRLMSHQPEELCISSITMAELEYGVCNSSRPGQNRLALMAFLSQLAVLPFDADAARDYGDIRNDLTKKGQIIFGIGCGLITVLIRYFGSYPEGVSYAILIMNLTVWMIDKNTAPRRFGTEPKRPLRKLFAKKGKKGDDAA